ncbi:hypothetical protein [Actinomadura roseirufa]|uniref:hypothetical protein n=1 Tax=Actinomadura roseirufa TaxID=2094049 RepID=UPI0010411589|nr:hypothetical protein [Actinomadura roseirufa]
MAFPLGRTGRKERGTRAGRRPWQGRQLWTRRKTPGDAGTGAAAERRPRRWRRSHHNPVSAIVLAAGLAAVAILALGMLLTWADANPGNGAVDATLDAGRWLATPFHDVFTRSDPKEQLYINWTITAVVYYALAKVASWMLRF